MRDANVLEAAEKCLEALPDWNLDAIDPEHSVIVTVDMNIGITREGSFGQSSGKCNCSCNCSFSAAMQ